MLSDSDKNELLELFGVSAIKHSKKIVHIYKRTKKKRIKRKYFKKMRKEIYPEIERVLDVFLPIQIQKQFENFASISNIR